MVDADKQIQITTTQTVGSVANTALGGLQNADNQNAAIRMKEGTWGPTIIMMSIILAPFVWHEWQVVLDSCRWLPGLN
ncbi:hypothetical protein [Bradyrhizobium cenepequi]|uniref:hypothetical protein n=1 Tax=Bradyrhizobium cenepequi TaxID=2821403 RepID=UPI001CE249EE|nr:hypothetical protein [Bradyrhizobium cenepequi]MCA6112652.1 hypothetical protein [Bradyrhizobium cenepequi]